MDAKGALQEGVFCAEDGLANFLRTEMRQCSRENDVCGQRNVGDDNVSFLGFPGKLGGSFLIRQMHALDLGCEFCAYAHVLVAVFGTECAPRINRAQRYVCDTNPLERLCPRAHSFMHAC